MCLNVVSRGALHIFIYKELEGVTRSYKELQGVTRSYKELQGVRGQMLYECPQSDKQMEILKWTSICPLTP